MTLTSILPLSLVVAVACAGVGFAASRPDASVPRESPAVGQGMPAIERGESESEGTVAEVLAASGYRYLRVTDPVGSDRWVVTLPLGGRTFSVGERVRVHGFGSRAPFTSKKLDRTFDHLTFAVVTRVDEPDARAR